MVVVVGLAVLPGVLPHVDVDDGGDVVGHPQAVHAEVGGGLQGEDVALPVEGAVEEHFHLLRLRFNWGDWDESLMTSIAILRFMPTYINVAIQVHL